MEPFFSDIRWDTFAADLVVVVLAVVVVGALVVDGRDRTGGLSTQQRIDGSEHFTLSRTYEE